MNNYILRENDFVVIFFEERVYFKKLEKGKSLNVKNKLLNFDELIGKEAGFFIDGFYVGKPSLDEIIRYGFRRNTQIIYPKDGFYIISKLDLRENQNILEFGTGSGAFSALISNYLPLSSKLYSFERKEEMFKNAIKNLKTFGFLKENTFFINKDYMEESFEENFFDRAFVDTKEPIDYIEKLYKELKQDSLVCFALPTYNQVINLLKALKNKFFVVEISEIIKRKLKVNEERLRPEDFTISHTALLLFARKIR